jgi:hypothetical protein
MKKDIVKIKKEAVDNLKVLSLVKKVNGRFRG